MAFRQGTADVLVPVGGAARLPSPGDLRDAPRFALPPMRHLRYPSGAREKTRGSSSVQTIFPDMGRIAAISHASRVPTRATGPGCG